MRVWPAGTPAPEPHVSIPEAWLDTIDEGIKHRGPDGQGRFRDRSVRADGAVVDVALVHRRLAIIDLGCGHQPMVSERGRTEAEGLVAVVFNGCIYNHRELRKELEGKGHRFVTDHSDTEVLVHGWREWGDGLAGRIDGMSAFALWDRGRAELYLSRDLAHEKPLHVLSYGFDELPEHMAFASVPSSLTALVREMKAEVLPTSEDWVGNWVRFGASSDDAIAGVRTWPARGMVHRHQIRDTGDWNFTELPSREEPAPLSEERADRLIAESVDARVGADVDLGCFLSGGVDSSLIAYHAKRALGQVRTFTVRMPDPAYDESAHAEAVARHLGTRHTTLDCEANPAEDLVMLIGQLGLPFGDSSLLPTYWLSKAARSVTKVALSGDGGDELFCGYERHVAALRLLEWAPLVRHLPRGLFQGRDPKGLSAKFRRLIPAARYGYWELTAIFQFPELDKLLPTLDFAWEGRGAFEDPAGLDFWNYLSDDLMVKSDTASMSVGLEVRSPFLSRALIDACLRAPYSDLMPDGERKGLLRAVARRYLPASIVDRPKQGFAIPIGEWFRSDYGGMKTLLMDHLNAADPWSKTGLEIDRRFVQQMVDEHMGRKRDHSQRLYMLLVLSIWARDLGKKASRQ